MKTIKAHKKMNKSYLFYPLSPCPRAAFDVENPFEATADRRGVKNLDLETKSLRKAVEAEAILDSKKNLENQI